MRAPLYITDAASVAKETMRRVRKDLELLYKRLIKIGYKFQSLDEVLVEPASDILTRIESFEKENGFLPLSLKAFYTIVGSVDFTQDEEQFINSYDREDENYLLEIHGKKEVDPVDIIGEEDPIVVYPFKVLEHTTRRKNGKIYFCWSPDEFHKANYSGGENYHFLLPDLNADIIIDEDGYYGMQEWFVEHLRWCIKQGGFRGISGWDEELLVAFKQVPSNPIIKELKKDLIEF